MGMHETANILMSAPVEIFKITITLCWNNQYHYQRHTLSIWHNLLPRSIKGLLTLIVGKLDMLRLHKVARIIKGKAQTVGGVMSQVATAVTPKTPPPAPVVMEPLPLWQLASSGGYYVRLAGVLGASAVALGAYGAHSSFPKDDKIELKEVFERANKYHFIHSLAMLGVPLCRWPKTSGTFFMLGIAMFSGTCYYLALTGDRSFNKITPIGGICFILGWLALAL